MSVLLEKTISLLKASPVTLIDLAKELGTTPQTLSNIRNGCKNIPSVELCEKLYVRLSGKQLEL
jgi:DNA-binding XRE family transcriptional regulator